MIESFQTGKRLAHTIQRVGNSLDALIEGIQIKTFEFLEKVFGRLGDILKRRTYSFQSACRLPKRRHAVCHTLEMLEPLTA